MIIACQLGKIALEGTFNPFQQVYSNQQSLHEPHSMHLAGFLHSVC